MLCARGFRHQLVPLILGKARILQVRDVGEAQLDVFIRLVVGLRRSRTELKAPGGLHVRESVMDQLLADEFELLRCP
jgi:hypothetical protein